MEKRSHAVRAVWFLLPVLLLWMLGAGQLFGAEIYRYVKKDGTVVYTDTPAHPAGVEVERLGPMPEMTPKERKEWENKQEADMEQYRQDEARRKRDETVIAPLREEYEAALRTLDHYKVRLRHDSYTNARMVYWKKKIEEQEEVVAEKKLKLEEAENLPAPSLPPQHSRPASAPAARGEDEDDM